MGTPTKESHMPRIISGTKYQSTVQGATDTDGELAAGWSEWFLDTQADADAEPRRAGVYRMTEAGRVPAYIDLRSVTGMPDKDGNRQHTMELTLTVPNDNAGIDASLTYPARVLSTLLGVDAVRLAGGPFNNGWSFHIDAPLDVPAPRYFVCIDGAFEGDSLPLAEAAAKLEAMHAEDPTLVDFPMNLTIDTDTVPPADEEADDDA